MTDLSNPETGFESDALLFQLEAHLDERGNLHSVDFSSLPFKPQRMFFVTPSRAGEKRGGHAHKTAHQLLICASGQIEIVVAYAGKEERFCLDRPGMAIYLRPLVWSEQTYISAGAVLLVLSSEHYDPATYSYYRENPMACRGI